MNKNIFGNPESIRRAQNLKSGDHSAYINWDAISELPDEYEVVITEITYNPNDLEKDFSDIGNNNYMPTPALMYRIAEACGISGGENSITEPIIEEIDINPMLMKDIESEPTLRKMTVGRRVKKYSTRIQEDGTEIKSSICTSEYNVWERCKELWDKEEIYTEGYTKPSKYPPKYDTKFKRKFHFSSEMKFAHAKAETKAHEKSIRELASLQTGYKKEHLTSGSLFFARVRRSRKILQAETAARLAALSGSGGNKQIQQENKDATELLFHSEEKPAFAVIENTIDRRSHLLAIIENYEEQNYIVDNLKESVNNLTNWLKNNLNAEKDGKYWPRAINMLKKIEAIIPNEGKIDHDFY